jgi:hypothetical protein
VLFRSGSATQRASDAGFTLLDTDGIDFDSLTGIHGFSLDLSDNTDAGFYAVGSWYWVVVSSITVDSQTVNFIAAVFRIGAAENTAGYLPVDTVAISGDTTAANNAEAFFDGTGYAGTNNVIPTVTTLTGHTAQTGDVYALANGATGFAAIDTVVDAIKAKTDNLPADPADDSDIDTQLVAIAGYLDTEIAAILAAVDTEVAAIKAKTDNLPADPADQSAVEAAISAAHATTDGKIDTIDGIVDSILVDTGTTLDGKADQIVAATITNAAGVDIAADIIAIKAETAAILVDTGTTLDGKIDTIDGIVDAILVDTGTTLDTDIQSVINNQVVIDGKLDAIDNFLDTEVAAILEDTGTTLPASLAAMDGKIDTIDGIVDSILVDTGTTLQGELDGIQADTEDIQTKIGVAGAGLTAVPWNAAWDAEVQSECADALTAYDPPTNAEMEARTIVAASYFDPAADTVAHVTLVDTTTTNTDMVAAAPSAASVADAVWDETLGDHLGAGSTGNALNAAGAAGDPWATAIPGAYGAGTAGLLLGTTIPAAIDAIDNYVDTEIGALATAIADVPTVAEFEARSLPSADYTIVADLGTVQTADHTAAIADIPTVAEFNARTLASADYVVTTDTIAGVTLCGTCTTNTDMRGTDSAALASVCTEARLSELDAGTAGKAAHQIDIIQTDTTTDIPATITTMQGNVTDILTDTGTTLDDKIDTIDTVVDAIKAKTDSLTFTEAGQVDANVQYVNDVALTGDGSALNPWGPV